MTIPATGAGNRQFPARPAAARPRPAEPIRPRDPVGAYLTYRRVRADYAASRQEALEIRAALARWAAALAEARTGVVAAEKALATARARAAEADRAARGPYEAARAAFSATHAAHQAPIDRLHASLREAWDALDHAVHPGRPQADSLDADARAVRERIRGLDQRIARHYAELAQLSPYQPSYAGGARALRDVIRRLEDERRPLFAEYVALSSRGDAARAPQAAPESAAVSTAEARVAELERRLIEAQETYREATDGALFALDAEQQRYNRAMTGDRDAVADAERALAAAKRHFETVQAEYRVREPKPGFFKRLEQRLLHGLDARALWRNGWIS